MPVPPGQFQPPPPPIGPGQVQIILPTYVTPNHRKFYLIQLNMPLLSNS